MLNIVGGNLHNLREKNVVRLHGDNKRLVRLKKERRLPAYLSRNWAFHLEPVCAPLTLTLREASDRDYLEPVTQGVERHDL